MADDFRFYAGLESMDAALREEREKLQALARYYRGPRRVEDVRTTVTKCLNGVSLRDIDGASLQRLREWVDATIARVPAEYRDEARLEFDRGDDETPASLSVFWEEPRPAADIQADILEARAIEQQDRAKKEAQERQQYEALKAKFEGEESQ